MSEEENHCDGACGGHEHSAAGEAKNGDVKEGSAESSVTATANELLSLVNQTGAAAGPISVANLRAAIESMAVPVADAAKTVDSAKKKRYQFWETQPVSWFDDIITTNEPIQPDTPSDQLRTEPYSLPDGFHWSDVSVNDSSQLAELYQLLNENYVEDDDNMFRFDYSPEFLLWALTPPGWLEMWHCGVRVTKSNRLVGFIAGTPCRLRIYDRVLDLVEINFLCVHKRLRSKRVAPVLIREITRRVNQNGIFQAVYTAGRVLPTPVSTCRYYHRSLNPKKLVEVKFSHLAKNMTMQRMIKLYKLPTTTKNEGFRAMTEADEPDVFRILDTYLRRFDMAPVFSPEEFTHWFRPRPDVIDSYVVEDEGMIKAFASYYSLPSTVVAHPTHSSLRAAYAFYNVAQNNTEEAWTALLHDALVVAKNKGYDVFNALDLLDNKKFLEPLKFGLGDGCLQYYVYNWRCPSMESHKVGLVML